VHDEFYTSIMHVLRALLALH